MFKGGRHKERVCRVPSVRYESHMVPEKEDMVPPTESLMALRLMPNDPEAGRRQIQ